MGHVSKRRVGSAQLSLFTVVVDYRGGTYVSQCVARAPKDAVRRWARSEELHGVWGLGHAGRREITTQLDDKLRKERPVPLDGVVAVWCTSFALPRGFALLNIIKTAQAPARESGRSRRRRPTRR
jgi:hypothetical protein